MFTGNYMLFVSVCSKSDREKFAFDIDIIEAIDTIEIVEGIEIIIIIIISIGIFLTVTTSLTLSTFLVLVRTRWEHSPQKLSFHIGNLSPCSEFSVSR